MRPTGKTCAHSPHPALPGPSPIAQGSWTLCAAVGRVRGGQTPGSLKNSTAEWVPLRYELGSALDHGAMRALCKEVSHTVPPCPHQPQTATLQSAGCLSRQMAGHHPDQRSMEWRAQELSLGARVPELASWSLSSCVTLAKPPPLWALTSLPAKWGH